VTMGQRQASREWRKHLQPLDKGRAPGGTGLFSVSTH